VSLDFGIFGLSWTSTELTHGSVQKLTCQGDSAVQMLTWQLTGHVIGLYDGDVVVDMATNCAC
jgi:hypothetical protein